jgi:methionyl-tRNA synthetase
VSTVPADRRAEAFPAQRSETHPRQCKGLPKMSDDRRYYITTAIDYPNSRPHIGTAFEKIGADVQARFRRMEGFSVHFQMGNDENTIKVVQRAAELGVAPKPYVDDMARQFKDVWHALEISFDDFIQTSEERHHIGCQKFIQNVHDAGDIYKKAYKGLYCTGCEAFKTETELAEHGGKCPNHPNTPLKEVEEENYFFRLSKFAEPLLAYYKAHPEFIQPESRRNEVVNLVTSGLQDVSISRKGFTWGIPVPFDPEQTIYVWFDALLNYATAVGYGTDPERFARLWPADVHVIGKDITRFHCALWPAMLMSAGVELPKQVFAHGFVYNKGAKISKSAGTAIDPVDVFLRYGADAFRYIGDDSATSALLDVFRRYGPDALRYYFMKECAFGGDGNFSAERFVEVYNSDLAGGLGNLYSRVLTMCVKYFDGKLGGVPNYVGFDWWSVGGLQIPGAFVKDIRESVEEFKYSLALTMILRRVVDSANQYIKQKEPYHLIKEDPEACKYALVDLAEAIRVIAILLKPFLPQTAEAFYSAFNFDASQRWDEVCYDDAYREYPIPEMEMTRPERRPGPDLEVTAPLIDGKPQPLFPRIDTRTAG